MSSSGCIFITGANRGIGLGLTREFLSKGWRVLAGCRRPDAALELLSLAQMHRGQCEILALDVQQPASIESISRLLITNHESVNVLVNNAGVNPHPRDTTVDIIPVHTIAEVLDINLLGAIRMFQAVLPVMRGTVRPRIVNISSGAGSLAHNSSSHPQPAYCISKAGLNMFTRCAARDLPGFVIVSISPGWIKTEMGGWDATLDLSDATAALARTIISLEPANSGQWLDRFGQQSSYAW